MLPEEHAAAVLGDSVSRIQAVVRRHLARQGVSLAAARTLATLEREGPRPLSELAAVEQVTQPSMSALVARLELNRLVARSSDPADGRVAVVSITEEGRALVGSILDRRAALIHQHFAALVPEEREAITRALPALAGLIARLEGRPLVASAAR